MHVSCGDAGSSRADSPNGDVETSSGTSEDSGASTTEEQGKALLLMVNETISAERIVCGPLALAACGVAQCWLRGA